MFDFFKSLFKPPAASGETAKERLRLVLLSDHLSLAPDVVESLKRDLMEVISRYVEIDSAHADVTFEHREREIAMLASIPITGVRERKTPVAPERPLAAPPKSEPPPTPALDAAVASEGHSPAAIAALPIEPVAEIVAPAASETDEPLELAISAPKPQTQAKPKATPDAAAAPVRASNAAAAPRRRRRKKYAASAASAAAAAQHKDQNALGRQASAKA